MDEKDFDMKSEFKMLSELIQKLENIKDEIIVYLNSNEELNSSEKRMWILDIKETYYSIFAGMQMLEAAKKDKEKYLLSAQNFAFKAKSHLGQSVSELQRFNDEKAKKLKFELNRTFNKCYQTISDIIANLTDEKVVENIQRIIRSTETEYQLPCSVCGTTTVVFTTSVSAVVIKGITSSATFESKFMKKIITCLENDNLVKIHLLVKQKKTMEDGLDAYCPDCDKIYCRKHYNVREIWDDGYYDYSEGTCPNGHKRIIDD